MYVQYTDAMDFSDLPVIEKLRLTISNPTPPEPPQPDSSSSSSLSLDPQPQPQPSSCPHVLPQPTNPSNLTLRLPTSLSTLAHLPSVVTRHGISHNYNPPYEDTDTIVLTAPSGKFVDVRFPKEWDHYFSLQGNEKFWGISGVRSFRSGSGKGSGLGVDGDIGDDVSGGERAVAEVKEGDRGRNTDAESKETVNELEWESVLHGVRTREIDTRGITSEDEYEMVVMGDQTWVEISPSRERVMGRRVLCKQLWREVKLEATEGKPPAVVAELTKTTRGPRKGRIIRIGDYCQAVQQCPGPKGGNVIVARYRKVKADEGVQEGQRARDVDDEWVEDDRNMLTSIRNSNEAVFAQLMPCLWVCEDERRLGDVLANGPDTWEIVELER